MALAIILLAIPIAIYLALVLLPVGRAWFGVLALIALLLAYIWLGGIFAWDPLWTGNSRADAYTLAAANLYTIAGVAGAVTGFFGRLLAQRIDWLHYPLVAIGILVLVFAPLIYILGV